ncbi:CC/Se motif family (seleno)protein [Halomonas saccharevitans]|uniref:CC/Se motif family (Seleno)protein n=1 Tax=Halomonas saccharevitans TaxID=416872 RepID=A0ABU3NBI1_9GAMM|nr:CC/Se motif family (seleno)protein [Halomonas saccharevitans]MDT8878548.1 CC/Se motif family (seleno)protein [Halomonas saccharevitans]
MAIEISDRAREWLRKHGGVAMVRLSPRHGCCGGRADIAVAEARTPDAPEYFTRLERDDVVLYIDPTLVDQGLTLDVEGFRGLRHLFVDGASLSR